MGSFELKDFNSSKYLDSTSNTDNRGEEGLLVRDVVAAKEDVFPGSAVEGQLCPLL